MPEYRAYIIDHDGLIQSFEPLVCTDDDAAIANAKRLVDEHDVEVWQGARKVTTLAHRPNRRMNAGHEGKTSHVAEAK